MEPILVSVVIPVYNRGKILRNTLLSLARQTYPTSSYEVIVVDDGSTDDTLDILKQYSFENLIVTSHTVNKGAPAARNTGIQRAGGELIIFCDSDFIVPSTFIESHVKEHENKKDFAVSGMGHWHFIYSYEFMEKWSEMQQELLKEKWNDPFIHQRLMSFPDPHLLLEEEIYHETYQPFILHPNFQFVRTFEEIITKHGPMLDGFSLPWITFCTGNVSMPKHCLMELGGFDEQFYPLGYDDWELGYRFFLAGGKFCFSTSVEAFQQLTPANPNRGSIGVQNFRKFYQRHPHFDVFLLALDLKYAVPFTVISEIHQQHQLIKQMGGRYEILAEAFENMLKLLAIGRKPPFKTNPQFKILSSKQGNFTLEFENLKNNPNVQSWFNYFNKLLYKN